MVDARLPLGLFRLPILLVVPLVTLLLLGCTPAVTSAQESQPAEGAAEGVREGEAALEIDREHRVVRVRCQALRVDMPLEFFCVLWGTADHESVLRTRVKPSEIHAALLALGLEPGHPLRFVPQTKTWLPPSGPPISVLVEWEEGGETRRERAGRLVRDLEDGHPMPSRPFVFSGSRVLEDGVYAADITGQLVSLVNFEYSLMDVPELASNANETLEWEINPETMPPEGAMVWMVLEPVGGPEGESPDAAGPATRLSDDPITGSLRPGVPRHTIVVMVDGQGNVLVDNEPVARAAVDEAVRARLEAVTAEAADESLGGVRVRLSAPRGAPVEAVGRTLGQLVTAGIVDVRFVPPPDSEPMEAEGAPVEVLVGDGGRTITLRDGLKEGDAEPQNINAFITWAAGAATREALRSRPYLVKASPEATDTAPVDLAAPAAALYVLGFAEVRVEWAEDGAAGSEAAAARLRELRERWEAEVLPQGEAMRQAAQTHYEVMQAYQAEINRLLDEAEALRREMDLLQERYNGMTTPQPGEQE